MRFLKTFLRWLRARRGPVRLVRRDPADPADGVDLSSGDVVLVHCPGAVSDAESRRLTAAFERALPRRVRVVVLGPGVDFDVLAVVPTPEPSAGGA